MKFNKLSFVLLILSLVLVACGATGDGGDDGIALSQSIESADGTLTVNYPDGWFAEADAVSTETVQLTNSEALLAEEDLPTVEAGQIAVAVGWMDTEGFDTLLAEGEELSPAILVELLSGFFAADPEAEMASSEVSLGDNTGASITVENEGNGMTIIAVNMDGNYITLVGITVSDEAEANQELFQAILASASYTPAESE